MAYKIYRFESNDVLKILRKRVTEGLNELINYGGVCRTAPATPDLLNILTKDLTKVPS